MKPLVAEQPIGIEISRPDESLKDPSTGQYVSVIKTGKEQDACCILKQVGVPPRTIPKESQAQDAD